MASALGIGHLKAAKPTEQGRIRGLKASRSDVNGAKTVWQKCKVAP